MAGAIACALSAWRGYEDAQLLGVDADTIPSQAALEAHALSRAGPIYRRSCAACHGDTMAGDRRRGAPDLTDGAWLYGAGDVSDIEQTLTHGIRSGDPKGRNLASMPAYAQAEPYGRHAIPPLKPGDIRDVVEYLFAREGRPNDAPAAARGDTIFHTRGACYDCHGPDARGDGAIGAPNLTDQVWLYGDGGRASIHDSIAQGRAGACPSWVGRLSAAEIRALAVLVFARSHPRAGRT